MSPNTDASETGELKSKSRKRNTFYEFKRFVVHQDKCQMKVCTDSCVFGSYIAEQWKQSLSGCGDSGRRISVLDIGHGTGLLTFMLAQVLLDNNNNDSFGNVEMHGIELDHSAWEQSMQNLNLFQNEFTNAKGRISFHHGAIQDYMPPPPASASAAGHITYNYIICNPPFFSGKPRAWKSTSGAHALHTISLSHKDLSVALSRLLDRECSKASAWVMLPQHEMSQFEHMCIREHSLHPFSRLIVRDNPNSARVLRVITQFKWKKRGDSEKVVEEDSLYIKDKPGTSIDCYSDRFKTLMRDYYLFL